MDNNEVKSQCVGSQDSVLQVSVLERQCVGGQDSELVGEIESSIKEKLETSPHQKNAPECCIYKTPKILRKLNEAAYTPRLVSIGPFHHRDEELQPMQSVKYGYLQDYLSRTQKSIEELLTYIIGQKEKLKSYYAESIDPNASFVEMILVDGVFIIELLLRYHNFVATKNQKRSDSSPNAKKNQKHYDLNQTSDIIIDLCCMLENQLPFFIIKGLYEMGGIHNETGDKRVSFWDLAILLCSDTITPQESLPEVEVDVKHFLDMQRRLILPTTMKPVTYTRLKTARISATVLHEAGVKFRVGDESQSFLEIKFDKGKLEMPRFTFERSTETLIRNLMAYEQCHYGSETYLCDYFSLMDNLINTSKDVDLLVKKKIIINWLGDNDEVATLVNNLSKHVRFSYGRFYYSQLCEDLNDHCKKRWKKWLSTLKHDYLSTPWKIASTFAAVVLLVLTLIQTVYSIKSYKN